jgi:F0F1-type ATP synthase assembly protein I
MENKKTNNPLKSGRQFSGYARYSGAAIQMVVIILLGVWGGIKLDEKLNSDPAFTVILSLFSVFAALYLVLREFIGKSEKKDGSK